jgi:hypothetical protein
MPKYDPKSRDDVKKTMHEHKHEGKYKSDRQTVAVGLSKARRKGEKVPAKQDD